jgi:soluble lytic murein transglycosylase-like protein
VSWRTWLLGFVAGSVLASYVTLACAPTRAQSAEVATALNHAAAEYGVSSRCLWNIAWRESRYTPWVNNRQGSGAAGLMQFMPGTWRWMSTQAGYGGASVYDAWSAAHVAAWAIAHGYLSHWGGC